MKNNQLHEHINNLQPDTPELPQFQQRLRRTVLNQPRHRSRVSALWHRWLKPGETSVKRRRKLASAASVAMVVMLVAAVGIYSYRFSPKAVAEQAVDEGLVTLSAAPDTKLNTLFGQLGGDPKEALKEAKAAKDLTTITKAEFQIEQSKAAGIFASSLGAPGQPQTVAFGVNAPNGSKGAVGGGVMVTGNAATTAPGSAGTTQTESGTASFSSDGSGPTFTTSSGAVGGPVNVSFDPKTGATTTSGSVSVPPADTVTGEGPTTSTAPAFTKATSVSANVPTSLEPVKLPEPATYLRYTDKNGRTVVLSLDKDGTPIFKTVFMKASDTKNLLPKANG